MTSATKDSEGTWLSPPRIRGERWSALRIIFLEGWGRVWRERGEQVIVTGQTERSRVGFEVLPGREANLAEPLSLSSSETSSRRSRPSLPFRTEMDGG